MPQAVKFCIHCGIGKPLEEFHVKGTSQDGHSGCCKPCQAAYQKRWYSMNKTRVNANSREYYGKNREKVLAKSAEWHKANRGRTRAAQLKWSRQNKEKVIFNTAKQRARKNGIPFSIEKSDISIPIFCPILGIKLEVGGKRDNTPSLDRIIPTLGYVPGNIAVISNKANRMKNDATAQEHRLIADWVDKMTKGSEA